VVAGSQFFEDNGDRVMFLETMSECCQRSGWKIYAWVLMSNHYHWMVQTPQANLVSGMKWFQNAYTRRLNSRHKKWGHVFGGRYEAVVVNARRRMVAIMCFKLRCGERRKKGKRGKAKDAGI
jgi:putative transposase